MCQRKRRFRRDSIGAVCSGRDVGAFGHGYQTLTPEAEIVYVVSEFYTPGCERGLRYNDPALKIQWPLPVNLISDKDNSWELLDD